MSLGVYIGLPCYTTTRINVYGGVEQICLHSANIVPEKSISVSGLLFEVRF